MTDLPVDRPSQRRYALNGYLRLIALFGIAFYFILLTLPGGITKNSIASIDRREKVDCRELGWDIRMAKATLGMYQSQIKSTEESIQRISERLNETGPPCKAQLDRYQRADHRQQIRETRNTLEYWEQKLASSESSIKRCNTALASVRVAGSVKDIITILQALRDVTIIFNPKGLALYIVKMRVEAMLERHIQDLQRQVEKSKEEIEKWKSELETLEYLEAGGDLCEIHYRFVGVRIRLEGKLKGYQNDAKRTENNYKKLKERYDIYCQ